MTSAKTVTIERLGRHGDGVASVDGEDVFVPFTLSGETARVNIKQKWGELLSVETASPDRVKPLCRHFTKCGSCLLQHMSKEAYLGWKLKNVTQAFSERGINIEPEEVFSVDAQSRRRAAFSIRRTKKTIQLGFHGYKSDQVINLEECHILHPQIFTQLENIKNLLRPLLSRKTESRLHITNTRAGLDLWLDNTNKDLTAELRQDLSETLQKLPICRLVVGEETLFTTTPPYVLFKDIAVELPTGVFLQAAEQSQDYMSNIILEAVQGAKKIADLFCGIGTFTFPALYEKEVLAVEYDFTALEKLKAAYNKAQSQKRLKPLVTMPRDLFKDPLSAKELSAFDAVIFDPPRAGAIEQAKELAASNVPVVVAVSCNPTTLARDVKQLTDAGYQIYRTVPIDQFLYSAHTEVIVVLKKITS